jgi:ribonuclease P protein component
VAFAIGRRVGGAVVRNRLRRRLRAVLTTLGPGAGDYLIGAGPQAADLPFCDLKDLVSHALQALPPPVRDTVTAP